MASEAFEHYKAVTGDPPLVRGKFGYPLFDVTTKANFLWLLGKTDLDPNARELVELLSAEIQELKRQVDELRTAVSLEQLRALNSRPTATAYEGVGVGTPP